MKKFLLSFAAAALAVSAQAGVDYPNDFDKVFDSFASLEDNIKGWIIYAPEGTPSGQYAERFFSDYSPSNAVRVLQGSATGLWSVSQYTNGQASDTWMITPEIEVTSDMEMLSFTVEAIGVPSSSTNNYAVYVSEGGVSKEDFQEFQIGSLTGKGDNVATVTRRFQFAGYEGKKIRLAFVNQGNKAGIMSYGDIALGSWYITSLPDSSYFNYIMIDPGQGFDFNMRVSTPTTASGYTVDFKTSGGFTYSGTVTRTLRLNTVSTIPVSIPDIKLNDKVEDYTLTVTPEFDGSRPLVISGLVINNSTVERTFDAVGVMEEGTGTWCGWCPYGAAALGFYSNLYNGENGASKAIAIAIHSGDPMEIPVSVSDYLPEYLTENEVEGFPAVTVNRLATVTPSTNPTVVGTELTKVFEARSYAKAGLDAVYYLPSEGPEMFADFSLETSFDNLEGLLAVSAIITENDVQGNNTDYNQSSYVAQYGDNANTIRRRLGEDWIPYFEPYFGVSYVFFPQIQYPHVARGAFPSYAGIGMPAFGKSETYTGRIAFEMPQNVLIKENTSVVLIVRNTATGEIVAADELSYDKFTFESGVDSVKDSAEVISTEYYTLDGRRVANPERGIFIRLSRMSDGSFSSEKVVR